MKSRLGKLTFQLSTDSQRNLQGRSSDRLRFQHIPVALRHLFEFVMAPGAGLERARGDIKILLENYTSARIVVGQNQRGSIHQRPGDGYPLLFAHRQDTRLVLQPRAES